MISRGLKCLELAGVVSNSRTDAVDQTSSSDSNTKNDVQPHQFPDIEFPIDLEENNSYFLLDNICHPDSNAKNDIQPHQLPENEIPIVLHENKTYFLLNNVYQPDSNAKSDVQPHQLPENETPKGIDENKTNFTDNIYQPDSNAKIEVLAHQSPENESLLHEYKPNFFLDNNCLSVDSVDLCESRDAGRRLLCSDNLGIVPLDSYEELGVVPLEDTSRKKKQSNARKQLFFEEDLQLNPATTTDLDEIIVILSKRLQILRERRSKVAKEGHRSSAGRKARNIKLLENALELAYRGKPVDVSKLPDPSETALITVLFNL